jgi:adenine phosphoribosyltransferase
MAGKRPISYLAIDHGPWTIDPYNLPMIDLSAFIRDVPDFPAAGIVFKDITPLLADGRAFVEAVTLMSEGIAMVEPTTIVAIESRGFIFGAPIAARLGVGFVPVRKFGKLPWRTFTQSYDLEYGTDTLEIHEDAVGPGSRVVVVDDVLATGGTAAATVELISAAGASVEAVSVLLELEFLQGRSRLDVPVQALIRHE